MKKNIRWTEEQIEVFCESADAYQDGSSGFWLVDEEQQVATHCSDVTYMRSDWGAVYTPTFENYQEFLKEIG